VVAFRQRLVASEGGGTFVSLKLHRNYRLFFVGQTISASGSLMQDSALPWLVLQETHSAFLVGLLVFCRYGPLGVLGLYGGVVADRLDNRRVLLLTQTVAMFVAVCLSVLAFTHHTPVWALCTLAAVGGLALAFDNPSKYALIYQLVGPKELANAISLNLSIQNSARVVGPAIGGVVIAAAGVSWCFVGNALSFVAVLVGLLLMRSGDLFAPVRTLGRSSATAALFEGLRFVRKVRDLQIIVALAVVAGLCGFSAVRTLLPVLARVTLHGGPRTFGALYAAYGAGAVAGALVSARLGRVSWLRLLIGGVVFSGTMLAMAPLHNPIAVGVLLWLLGAAWTTWSSQGQVIIQLTAPDGLRGRLISVYNSAQFIAVPLGGLAGGWLAGYGGTGLAFSLAGAIGLSSVIVGYVLHVSAERAAATTSGL
jgi:MFS family permease